MDELSSRKRIYEEILLNPGLHFRELQRRLDMPVGMLSYHLNVLIQRGLIVAKKEGKYTRYFANTTMTREERQIMGLLRNSIARKIVIYLLQEGEKSHGEIARYLNLRPSTLSYHLNRLTRRGLLDRDIRGRETYYRVKKPQEVAFIIIKYRKSFLDALVDNFASLWLEKE